MQLDFDINFVVGKKENFLKIAEHKPLKIFSEKVCSFLNTLSKRLLEEPQAKQFSDVVTFAFWCRRASINQISVPYIKDFDSRFGRGVIFHIAPSNVAVNFAYSFVAGFLSGNINIVRLPSKPFPQVSIICNAIRKLLETEFSELNPYVYMVSYGHEKEITDLFSSICDIRIIWGGDNAINNIRKSPLKIRATEISFSDRYSIAVINADEYLKSENKINIARNFYNDTYLNDQNACSSPKAVIWLGKERSLAKKIFWEHLYQFIESKYYLKPVQAIDKLTKFFILATKQNVKLIKSPDNRIFRIEIFDLNSLEDFNGNSGFFIEYEAENLSEIIPICGERCQTLSYFGMEHKFLKEFFILNRPKGIDRIVPMGMTLNFSLIWDGYDLIYSTSRIISSQVQ